MMGTNPLTFAMPTDEEFPFLLDCATSIIQNGKIEYYARIGKDTPAGMVIGRDGSTLTDSARSSKIFAAEMQPWLRWEASVKHLPDIKDMDMLLLWKFFPQLCSQEFS